MEIIALLNNLTFPSTITFFGASNFYSFTARPNHHARVFEIDINQSCFQILVGLLLPELPLDDPYNPNPTIKIRLSTQNWRNRSNKKSFNYKSHKVYMTIWKEWAQILKNCNLHFFLQIRSLIKLFSMLWDQVALILLFTSQFTVLNNHLCASDNIVLSKLRLSWLLALTI